MKLPPLICSVILSKPSIGSKRATGNFHPCFARFLFASPSARKETSTPGSRICCFDPARPCENKFPPRVYTVFCSAQLKDHRRKSTQFRKCTAKDLRPQFMLHGLPCHVDLKWRKAVLPQSYVAHHGFTDTESGILAPETWGATIHLPILVPETWGATVHLPGSGVRSVRTRTERRATTCTGQFHCSDTNLPQWSVAD